MPSTELLDQLAYALIQPQLEAWLASGCLDPLPDVSACEGQKNAAVGESQ